MTNLPNIDLVWQCCQLPALYFIWTLWSTFVNFRAYTISDRQTSICWSHWEHIGIRWRPSA